METIENETAIVPTGHLSRRQFLGLAGGVGVLATLGATLGPRMWDSAFASSSVASGAKASTLVLVTLYGGNDGLNMVIPYLDPAYAAARGSLAVDASKVLGLSDGFGLNPAMPGLKKLWDAKQLAVVHGVGFADPNYSHFQSMDIWQSGVPGSPVSTGWLGRWLDATNASPLTALAVGPNVPVALAGERVQASAVPVGKLILPGGASEQAAYATMAATTVGQPALLAETAASGADLLLVNSRIGPLLNHTALGSDTSGSLAISNGGGGQATPGVLATQLSVVANLILAGGPSQVYSVELGGFDTHSDQEPTQTGLLTQLDSAVSAFVDAMASNPRGRQTTMLVYTEFGRRVAGNSSGGTDHGWANPVLVAGPPVKGGFYGSPPSLSKLSDGNQIYTTDFRSVYSTVMSHVLGIDPKGFLDGSFPTIGFL